MKLLLNLASRPYVNRRALYAFYALLTCILLVLLFFNGHYFLELKAHARQIENHLRQLGRSSGPDTSGGKIDPMDFEELKGEIAFVNEILQKDSFRWTILLNQLEEVVAEGVSLKSIHPNFKEKSLNITAEARDTETLRLFLDRMIASPHFSEVFLFRQAKVTVKDGQGREHDAVSFSLVLKEAF